MSAHVRIITQVFGRKVGLRPSFYFGAANETDEAFTRTAVAIPSPKALDEPKSLQSVSGALARTRFIVRRPRTTSLRRPRFTG